METDSQALELKTLLERTSRTFALAIPLLEEPLASEVGLAYLLFRLADTLEDAPLWRRQTRHRALLSFGTWMDRGEERGWLGQVADSPPSTDAGCLALIARADAVRAAALARHRVAAAAIRTHVLRTTEGMAAFVARQGESGSIVLRDVDDLKAYCYVVAGIVGELLTELFVNASPALASEQAALVELAPAFGEALQLVNILKDAPSDAREGRMYIPPSVARDEVVRLARADLASANAYVALLDAAGAPRGVRTFCELPLRLAEATLTRLDEGAEKLGRADVMRIVADVHARP